MGVSKRAKKTLITFGAIVFALPAGAWLVDSLTPSIVRQALPTTATEVQEYYSDDGFQGDFLRCLQAKMPQAEMPKFASKLGLVQRYNSSKHSKLPLSFSADSAASWWHSPDKLEGAYFEYTPGEEAYSIATYQNGYVYYKTVAW